MDVGQVLERILPELLMWLIIAGWIVLLVAGLEADKPLSGGIPGHVEAAREVEEATEEGFLGKLGTLAGWAIFLAVSASLPLILWWILTVHEK